MIVKFETKSKRVKGLAFHPIRPWLLSALHTGQIQLWDYRLKTLLDEFVDHEGPVRGIDFHQNQPLFVSGGDDFKIRVWSYKQRKCLFVMKGHLDYIRTVQFHRELPWIISSSDDQTIRIWNWQSRSMIAILTGHSHYVMCAKFHPTQDLIVSCSLDQTLRIWDFSATRKKSMQQNSKAQNVLGANEVEVHSVLETHERGVNWCDFHPEMNMIVSGADDRKIKLWKFNESRAWDHDSLYGHKNNVSSVVFHPKLISNSEDKTTKVWDLNKRVAISTFTRDNDRFWVVAVHPQNLTFASGCDNGFYVFSLFSDKMPQSLPDPNSLIFGFRKQIKAFNFNKKAMNIAKELESSASVVQENINFFQQNPFETSQIQFLIGTDTKDKGINKFYLLTYNTNQYDDLQKQREDLKTFTGKGAVFVSKNKIVRIKENKEVEIYNFDLNTQSNPISEVQDVNRVFTGPIGNVIFTTDDSLMLYNITTKKEVCKIPMKAEYKVKSAYWNKNNTMVALVAKKSINIMNKNLGKICSINEKFNVKSLIWNGNVIIYTTINHLKFGLLNGDSGIIKCVDENLKAIKIEGNFIIKGNTLFAINSAAEVIQININCEELLLKKSLFDKNWEKIKYYMDSNNKLGNSVISYLYKKNYSGIALNLVNDPKTKFSLAINSGNLEQAFKSAKELKDKDIWAKLAEEAVRQGNHQIVEIAYQNIKEYEKLSFLYTIIGKTEYLNKMLEISTKRGDIMSRFSNALLLGSVEERIKILADSNQLALAYLMAVAHNKSEYAETLKKGLEKVPNIEQLKKYKMTALIPPKPLVKNFESSAQAGRNWPQNHIPEEYMVVLADQDQGEQQTNLPENAVQQNIVDEEPYGVDEDVKKVETNKPNFMNEAEDEEVVGETGWEDELDLPDDEPVQTSQGVEQPSTQSQPSTVAESKLLKTVKQSLIPSNHIIFGFFENAFSFWKKQFGIYNFDPLQPEALKVATSSFTIVPGIPFVLPQIVPVHQDNKPFVCRNFNTLEGLLKKAQKLTAEGKFGESEKAFLEVLYQIPFVKFHKEQEITEVKQLLVICFNYIMAMRCELRKAQEPDRAFELTCYMGICNLKPSHRVLTLRAAMNSAYKLNNFIYSSQFAKKLIRILEANPNAAKPEVLQSAQKVLKACEAKGTNASQIVFDDAWLYDDDSTYNIDPSTVKINKNVKDAVKCPYCTAKVDNSLNDTICPLCNLGKLGAQVMGIKLDN